MRYFPIAMLSTKATSAAENQVDTAMVTTRKP